MSEVQTYTEAGVPRMQHHDTAADWEREAARLRAKEVENLGGHDRDVRGHQMPNSDSARASSSVYASRCSFVRKRSWFQTSR